MSAIFGIFERDGAATPPHHLDLMAAQLTALGTAGARRQFDGGLAAGCLWWTDVAGVAQDASLHIDRASGLVTIAEGWMPDRDDLARNLPLAFAPSLAELASAMWLRGEHRFFADLAGEFTIVLWEPHDRILRLVASPAGNPMCYLWESPDRIVFASRVRALHAVPGIERRLDLQYLAASAVPAFTRVYRRGTLFTGVDRLRPGTLREYSPSRSEIRKWWTLDASFESQSTPDQIVEALSDRLSTVLRARLAGPAPAASLLSGGLDSSTVTTYAHAAGNSTGLFALSAVHSQSDEPDVDERRFIHAVRDHLGLNVVEVAARGRGPFDDLPVLTRTGETYSTTSRHYLYSALAEAARHRGARVLLDGFGGELTLTCEGTDAILDAVLGGRLRAAGAALRAYSRARGSSTMRAVYSLLLGPLLGERLTYRRPPDFSAALQGSPFRSDFLAAQQIDPAGLASRVTALTRPRPGHRANLVHQLNHPPSGVVAFAGADDVTFSFPLFDRRIVEISLGARPDAKMLDGLPRGLARRMLRDRVPDLVRCRTDKMPFSPDYELRFRSQLSAARHDLESIAGADPIRDIVDVPKLVELATRLEAGTGPQARDSLHTLPTGAYLIAFLRPFGV